MTDQNDQATHQIQNTQCDWSDLRPDEAVTPPTPQEQTEIPGMQMIENERLRQVTEEGYSTGHDDAHDKSELCRAADCYAMEPWQRDQPGVSYTQGGIGNTHPKMWPWDKASWKPSNDRKRELVKAGALYRSEIERLQRKIEQIAYEINIL